MSSNASFLSRFVPSYLENRFNLPVYQLNPIKHRSTYRRFYSSSPFIFKRINWILVLLGGSLVSFLLYFLFGIAYRQQQKRRRGGANGTVPGDEQVSGREENLFQLPEIQPLMERIDRLQQKHKDLETDEKVQEYVEQVGKEEAAKEQGKSDTVSAAEQDTTTPQRSAPQIPVEVYTRQLRSMISQHLDRVQRPQEYQAYLARPKPPIDATTRRQEVSAFIQEYSEKEQQFLNYCEKLLKVVDEKSSVAKSPKSVTPVKTPIRERMSNDGKKVTFRENHEKQSPVS